MHQRVCLPCFALCIFSIKAISSTALSEAVNFFEFLAEILAPQVCGNNLALAVEQHVGRYGVDAVEGSCGTLPALKVADVGPLHADALNGRLPCLGAVVERNAHYLEALGMIFLIVCHYVWHLLTARSAPACPEVNEHIVALAAPLAQLALLAFGVVHRQVCEHLAGHALLEGCKLLLDAGQGRMVIVRSRRT